MAKKIVMKDVADELGISIVSVHKAISGKEGVSEELRTQILNKAEEMGYSYDKKNGSEGEVSKNVAIIISEKFISEGSFYFKIYQNMIMKLSQAGFIGMLEIVRKDDEVNGRMPNVVNSNNLAGIIVIGEIKEALIDTLVTTGSKIIFFDFENENYDIDTVVSDNINGGFLLTGYLYKRGYKNIGFIGSYKQTRSILDRYMGYRKYLIAHDIKFEEKWVIEDRDEQGHYIEFNLPNKLPDAFVCNCDVIAYRLIDVLKEKGIKVPKDIAVVGYDDYAEKIPDNVKLNTYRVNTDGMIDQCVNLLNNYSNGILVKNGTTICYGNIVERETVKKKK